MSPVFLSDTFKKYSFVTSPDRDYFIPAPRLGEVLEPAPYLEDEIEEEIDFSEPLDDDIFVEEELPAPLKGEEGRLLLSVRGLNKVYKQGSNTLQILNNVDLRIYSGEIAALVGPSGSGKSTLLHILGLLDSPTSGQVVMEEKDISRLSDRIRTKLRNEHIGFVYQFHHLLPEFTALENVALPKVIGGKKPKDAKDMAVDLLEQMGLQHRLHHRPATLSGGEQQRVAIARALMNNPTLLFADEPTGNLDPETSAEVFEILLNHVRKRGIGALIATHNMELANQMDRILEVKSGRILPF